MIDCFRLAVESDRGQPVRWTADATTSPVRMVVADVFGTGVRGPAAVADHHRRAAARVGVAQVGRGRARALEGMDGPLGVGRAWAYTLANLPRSNLRKRDSAPLAAISRAMAA